MIKKQGSISFLLFLLGFSLLYFVFWGQITNTISNFKEHKNALNEEDAISRLVNQIPQLEQSFAKLNTDTGEIIASILPSESNISNTINQFQAISLSSGLVLNGVKIENINKGIMSLVIDAKGSIGSLERFITFLENNLPLIDIDSVQFRGGKIGSQLFHIVARTYVYEPNTKVATQGVDELITTLNNILNKDLEFLDNGLLDSFRENGNIPVQLPGSGKVGNNKLFE